MKKLLLLASFALFALSISANAQAPVPIKMGPNLPSTCAVNAKRTVLFYKTGASNGLYYCSSANTWTQAGGGSSGLVTGATDNAILRADGTGGATSQGSLVTISDTGSITVPNGQALLLEGGNGTQVFADGSGTLEFNGSFNNLVNLHNNYGLDIRTQAGLDSAAANVLKITGGKTANSNTLAGWLQTVGNKRVSSDVNNSTATMSNLTDLSIAVAAGRKYSGVYRIVALNSTAGEGVQFDFNGGSATITSIQFYLVSTPPGVTVGTVNSAAIGTALTATTATTVGRVYEIYFDVVVNAAGTLIPRFSEVSHTSGTATVKAGSTSYINDLP